MPALPLICDRRHRRLLPALILSLSMAGPALARGQGQGGSGFTPAEPEPLGVIRVSLDNRGRQADGRSTSPSVAIRGKGEDAEILVVFQSSAASLAPGIDRNGLSDVFLHRRRAPLNRMEVGRTAAFSLARGRTANGSSTGPVLSADGSAAAFVSRASVLSSNRGTRSQVHVAEDLRRIGQASLPDVRGFLNGAATEPDLSADGDRVVFTTDSALDRADRGLSDIYLRDLDRNRTLRVSLGSDRAPPNGASREPSLSADGRFVVFTTAAGNLVRGDTNRVEDVIWKDLETGRLRLVSLGADGRPANGPSGAAEISGDGRFVVFESAASNLVAGDRNGRRDIFLRDLERARTIRLSIGPDGREGNGDSTAPTIDHKGDWIAFQTRANTLFRNDRNGRTDVLVISRDGERSFRIGGPGGAAAEDDVETPSLSATGGILAVASDADTLVPGDTNGVSDVFVAQIPTEKE